MENSFFPGLSVSLSASLLISVLTFYLSLVTVSDETSADFHTDGVYGGL